MSIFKRFTDIIGAVGLNSAGVTITAPAGGTISVLPFFAGYSIAGNAGNFALPTRGLLSDFTVRSNSNQPAGGSFVWTVWINNTATALTITIPANGGSASYTDNVNSFSIASGDLIRFVGVNNDPANVSAGIISISILLSG